MWGFIVKVCMYMCSSIIKLKVYTYVVDVRLNRTGIRGFLEANEDSGWGPVCSNYFGTAHATVACRQLRLGLPISYSGNTTIANLPYYYLDLYCDGNEQRLTECYSYSYRQYNACYITYLQCSGTYIVKTNYSLTL